MSNDNRLIAPIHKVEVWVSSIILLRFCATVPHALLAHSYCFTQSLFTCPMYYHPGMCYQQMFMLVISIVCRYFKSRQAVTPKHSRLLSDHCILHWSDAVHLDQCARSRFWCSC